MESLSQLELIRVSFKNLSTLVVIRSFFFASELLLPNPSHPTSPPHTHTLAFLEIDLGCFSLSRDCSPVAEVLAITLATFYSFVGTPHVPLRWLLSLVLRQPRTTYTCYVF